MKKLNNKGFGLVEGLLLVLILGIVAGTVFYVYSSNKKVGNGSDGTNIVKEENLQKEDNKSEYIVEVNLDIETAKDLDKLPSITPASFKDHLLSKISKDNSSCRVIYMVKKISKANIEGGVAIDMDDIEKCGSGAPLLWVIDPEGKWESFGLNGNPGCKTESGGLVYEEFADKCYKDKELKMLIKNPNGSVADL